MCFRVSRPHLTTALNAERECIETSVVEALTISGSHPLVITSLSVFAVFFPTFLWVESWVDRPIMPLYLIKTAPRANLIFANHIASFLTNAIAFNM